VKNLLWFHAFRRSSVEDILHALRTGPVPPPATVVSKTSVNERRLGLPSSVYAYLGRSSELFGANGFAVPLSSPKGSISPFDTGGLVDHIDPVNGWDDAERQGFVGDYSWTDAALIECLSSHPTPAGVIDYLDGREPPHTGPHALWVGRQAEIWKPGVNQWPAWTWEIRSGKLTAGTDIVCWTCPPHIFSQIQIIADNTPADIDWFEFLFGRYEPGGVSQLLAIKRSAQEAV
jgi:hypothetical protein